MPRFATFAAWTSALVPLLACAPDDAANETVFETADLAIRRVSGETLCRGSVDGVVEEYERVRSLHSEGDADPLEQLVVRLGNAAAEEFCGSRMVDVAGCAGRSDHGTLLAAGQVDVISHELVHGVRLQFGHYGNRFIEEGLAEFDRAGVFGDYGVMRTSVDVDAELEAFGNDGASYLGAMTFVAYLAERYGEDALREATRAPSYANASSRAELDAWFMRSFGEPLESAIALYAGPDSAVIIDRPGPCHAEEIGLPASVNTLDVACSTNAVGVIEPELGDPRIESTPECFIAPQEGATVSHHASDEVTIVLTSWACEDGEPRRRTGTVLRAGEDAQVPAGSCLFSVASSGPPEGYTLEWTLEPL